MMNKKVIAVALALALAGGSYAQDDTAKKKVKAYMVSDAHLDTQWNWDIQTTINEYVWNTISQNLFLLKKYPEYVFNFEGGVKYAWMKEYYPEQYEEMKKFIEEGRWHIAGSSWEASDVLVPSVEASIRNIMLGQTYYRQEFGKEGTDIFLPDCFGFGWTLPTIAAHCGLIGFSSQKLDWRNHPFYGKSKHPFTIGLWKGIDGKQVMLAHGYDYGRKWNNEDLSKNKDLEKLAQRTPLNTVYRYYGTGDIGGSPTLGSVRSVEQGIKGDGPVEVISATSDQLFKDYLPFNNHPELPVFDGELLMDVHGTGCYTSQAAMKLYNRQNEQLGDAAERAAVAAEWLGTASYPQHTLTEAWKRFIFHQFHDDLTGTSIPRAYEFSWNDELISLKQFSQVLTSSVNAIAGQMDTRVKGTPVVLYNANAFPVSDLTEIILEQPKTPKGFTVYNAQGKKVASQMIGYENGRAHILVAASLPANSYAVYDVRTGGSEKTISPSAASAIENSVYKITLDKNGDIISLTDKRNNKELVKDGKAIRLALFTENKSYAWPAWEILKETIDREPVSITDGAKITLVENGALRKALCIEKKYGKSLFKQYIRPFFLLLTGKARMLQNNLKILTHRKFSEDGTLLREVRNAHTCALMERPRANILILKENSPGRRFDDPGQHIERSGFARPVRAEQTDDFPLVHFGGNTAYDLALAVPFAQVNAGQSGHQRFPRIGLEFLEPEKTASTRFLDPPMTSLRFSSVKYLMVSPVTVFSPSVRRGSPSMRRTPSFIV